VPVRLDFLDELNHVGNMLRRLADDVGTADVHRVDVGKERVRVEACNLEHGLMPFLSRLHHLVGSVVGIARKMADYVIEIPESESIYSPLLATIPLQILAYYIAVMRGCNVDQPRNLAKSVTVE
jgi:hypothetical protein